MVLKIFSGIHIRFVGPSTLHGSIKTRTDTYYNVGRKPSLDKSRIYGSRSLNKKSNETLKNTMI